MSTITYKQQTNRTFYRATHVVRKSSVCPSVRPSVCLSVCLSVALMYRERIGWTSSKLITRIIGLGLRTSEPHHIGNLLQRNTPKFKRNMGRVDVLNRKPAISLKPGKVGPRLLLMANRKSHTCFQLVPKSTIKVTYLISYSII